MPATAFLLTGYSEALEDAFDVHLALQADLEEDGGGPAVSMAEMLADVLGGSRA